MQQGADSWAEMRWSVEVAVLFARDDSVYKQLPGCDVYDIARDARNYTGSLPVVAHPPCRAWASLRFHAKPRPDEKHLALFAVDQIRRHGGVLEHPQKSTLWPTAGLPEPGKRDKYGGFTLVVNQHWWGHRAQKATRLYIVGIEPREVPAFPIRIDEPTHTVGLWSGRNRATCRPSIGKKEYESTPHEFAQWLVDLAKRCGK